MKSLKITAITFAVILATSFAFAEPIGNPVSSSAKTRIELLHSKASTTIEKLREQENALRAKASTTRVELQDMRAQVQVKRAEVKNNFDTKKIAILKITAENTMRVLDAAMVRLEKIATRIDLRIAKMEANKIDVTQAKADMIIARQKIADAKTSLASAKTIIAEMETQISATSTDASLGIMGAGRQKIKYQAKAVKDSLQSAKELLTKVIKELIGKEGTKIEKTANGCIMGLLPNTIFSKF